MTEVEPRLKPEITPCPCGCGVEARPLAKQNRDGTHHARGCSCRSCKGRRNRKSGLDAQRRAAKRLGVPYVGPLRPSNEEDFAGLLRVEVKSGAQVKPMWTAYNKAEAQSEAQRPIGDTRKFVFAARLKPSSNDGLICFRERDLEAVWYALGEQLGYLR